MPLAFAPFGRYEGQLGRRAGIARIAAVGVPPGARRIRRSEVERLAGCHRVHIRDQGYNGTRTGYWGGFEGEGGSGERDCYEDERAAFRAPQRP